MARARSLPKHNSKADRKTHEKPSQSAVGEWFAWFACAVAHLSGRPAAFLIATASVVIWAVTGPYFHYSDTWQLVINTSTTIVTFLMVFLIQNTQNRDTMALQIKLSELIIAMNGAKNKLAVAEDLSDEDLQRLHDHYREGADEVMESLNERQAAKAKHQAKKESTC